MLSIWRREITPDLGIDAERGHDGQRQTEARPDEPDKQLRRGDTAARI